MDTELVHRGEPGRLLSTEGAVGSGQDRAVQEILDLRASPERLKLVTALKSELVRKIAAKDQDVKAKAASMTIAVDKAKAANAQQSKEVAWYGTLC